MKLNTSSHYFSLSQHQLLLTKPMYGGDDGSLTIIQSESKPDVQLIVGEDSNTEIAVTPKEGETVFVYGDELTIIQDTPLGIIQY